MSRRVGIELLNVYPGLAYIGVADLLAGRGLDLDRMDNLGMTERSVGLPFEDPVTNAVNAARPLLDAIPERERARIECLLVTTESGVDLSKSVASYVHRHLGLSPRCRVLEVKQACYSATGALQLAAGLLASGMVEDAKALVIGSDVALVDERAQYAEACTGHGAVAMLLGTEDPGLLALDPGAYGTYGYEALDSARPTPTMDIAAPDESLFTYLDCLDRSFADYRSRVESADLRTTFALLAFHTPFAGLVKAGHRNLMRAAGVSLDGVAADFERRVAPGLQFQRRTGNLCSASVYLGLASAIENTRVTLPQRVGLYSYGSGCCSEFFSGVVGPQARNRLTGDVGAALDSRLELGWEEYLDLLALTRGVLEPVADRAVPQDLVDLAGDRATRPPFLVWTGTRSHHREYAWV